MPLVCQSIARHGFKQSKGIKYSISVSKDLELRVYSDTRPCNGKIADLQKGLILVYKGIETVGEGTGFGVPIIVYSDETYFSGTSSVSLSQKGSLTIASKKFFMDRIARSKFGSFRLENSKTRGIIRYTSALYQRNRHLRLLILKRLLSDMGYRTSFVKTAPIGTVITTYAIHEGRIEVKTTLSLVNKQNVQRIFVLNEQGAGFFRKSFDSDGLELFDKEIGAWDSVEAEWTSLTDPDEGIGFRLWKMKNSVLRRGRESLEGSLDWVGLDYEINPRTSVFEYEIEISEEPNLLK